MRGSIQVSTVRRLCMLILASVVHMQGCGGGGSGGDSDNSLVPEIPPLFDADNVRLYQLGDVVEFSGTLSCQEATAAPEVEDVRVRVEFMDNVYGHEGKDVLQVATNLTLDAIGEDITHSVHVWQEANGALFDSNNEFGHVYLDSAINENGLPSFPVPLMPMAEHQYQFFTVAGDHTSTLVTMGERSISVGEMVVLDGPNGPVDSYPVRRTDDYIYLLTYAEHKRDEQVVDELQQWVAPTLGVVKLIDVRRVFLPSGALKETCILDVEATSTNF